MGRYFEEEEEAEAEEPGREREVILSTGALIGLVFALVLFCGLCFGAGYLVGHRSSGPSAAANAPVPAPEQEPLQANDSIPKPSASNQTAPPAQQAPQADDSPTNPEPGSPAANANPTTTPQSPAGSQPGGSPAGSPTTTAQSPPQPVRSALPTAGKAPPAQGAPNVRTALPAESNSPASSKLMVQIAAVGNPEDADVLVTALRKRGYSVTAARDPGDGLIHVKIGPFNSRDEANHWRDKLLGDGYNAVVQP